MTLKEQYFKEIKDDPTILGYPWKYIDWLEDKIDNNNKAIVDRLESIKTVCEKMNEYDDMITDLIQDIKQNNLGGSDE